ncbi:hypothetical protein ACFX11_003778 [Malus domestica]
MAAVVMRPTKAEQLDFLHLRQQLKDRIRMKKSGGSAAAHFCSVSSTADDNKKKLPFDNFGSFFGPLERVMMKRVREEKKDFMPELKKLASRVLNSGDKSKASVKSHAPLSTALKCKMIKESRVTPFCNRTVQKFQSLQNEESLKKLAKPNPPRQSLNLLKQCKAWSKQSNVAQNQSRNRKNLSQNIRSNIAWRRVQRM